MTEPATNKQRCGGGLLPLFSTKECVTICAPMVRYSKLPFRLTAREYGCDVCYTPMIVADSFVASPVSSPPRHCFEPPSCPLPLFARGPLGEAACTKSTPNGVPSSTNGGSEPVRPLQRVLDRPRWTGPPPGRAGPGALLTSHCISHCLSLTSRRLSHCLSLTSRCLSHCISHCLSLTSRCLSHCLYLTSHFPLPFTGHCAASWLHSLSDREKEAAERKRQRSRTGSGQQQQRTEAGSAERGDQRQSRRNQAGGDSSRGGGGRWAAAGGRAGGGEQRDFPSPAAPIGFAAAWPRCRRVSDMWSGLGLLVRGIGPSDARQGGRYDLRTRGRG